MIEPTADLPTREQCLQRAAQALVDSRALQASRTPRAAAEAAHYPGHRLSVDQLEDLIRERRGLPPIHREAITRTQDGPDAC